MTKNHVATSARAAAALLVVTTMIMACGIGVEEGDPTRAYATATDGSTSSMADALAPAAAGSTPMSPALRAATFRARQNEAGPAYRSYPVAGADETDHDAVLAEASNPAQRMGLRFHPWGPRAELPAGPDQPAVDVAFELLSLKRGGVGGEAPVVDDVEVNGAEVRYERGSITEWYLNGPVGLEQGFELGERVEGQDALWLAVGVYGDLHPELQDETVALVDAEGQPRARYGRLFVEDADGAVVPSRLKVEGDTIVLVLEDAEARYPLSVDPFVWTETAKLTASDGVTNAFYGEAVSLSADGMTALIGAPIIGAAYVLVNSGSGWTEVAKLAPASFASTFGTSVSLSADGTVALIGACCLVPDPTAHVFENTGSGWTEVATLIGSDLDGNEDFGHSVSLSEDGLTALIGAPIEGGGSGAAYVFKDGGTTWFEAEKLLPPTSSCFCEQFGHSVSLSSDGLTALIGAWGDDDQGSFTGSAFVFEDAGSGLAQVAKLTASDGFANARFGQSVSLTPDGLRALVGAHSGNLSGIGPGSAYVFEDTASGWGEVAKLVPSDAANQDEFGYSVSLSSDGLTALVGAPSDDDNGTTSGSAYLFDDGGSSWSQTAKVIASDGAADDAFGRSVSLSADGARALIGAYGDDDDGSSSGSAYVYELLGDLGQTCSAGGDCASGFCSDGVCCDTACAGGTNDCQACTAALTGGVDGTCAPIPTGTACGDGSDTACTDPDTCDGSGSCLDNHAAAGDPCGDQGVPCAIDDTCDGGGACTDNGFEPATTVCRAAAGDCDVAETCTGNGAGCPTDAKEPSSTICRPSTGACDPAESCDGSSDTCPTDSFASIGTACGDATDTACTDPDSCDGSGSCLDNHAAAGDPCGDQGVPCAIDDTCDGGGACTDNGFEPATTVCRAAAGDCDVAETCTGAGSGCPADEKEPATTVCRASAGICDVAESCDGSSDLCPDDGFEPVGTECRAATGDCDQAESCDGATVECPADAAEPDGTSCDDGDSCTEGDVCAEGACASGEDVCTGEGGAGGAGGAGGSEPTGGAGGSDSAGGAGGAMSQDPASSAESGCGCHTVGGANPAVPSRDLTGLALLGLVALFRRRRRQGLPS